MKAKIVSLKSVVLEPESDLEKLIFDSWYGKKVLVSPGINNAGLDYPTRYISLNIFFEDKE